MSCPSACKRLRSLTMDKHSNIAFITSNGNTMVPLHLLTSSTCYSDIPWLIIQKSIGSWYSYETYSSGQHTKKTSLSSRWQNNVQLLPYSAQFIIRSVLSLQGSVILLGSNVRQCSHKLALEARD